MPNRSSICMAVQVDPSATVTAAVEKASATETSMTTREKCDKAAHTALPSPRCGPFLAGKPQVHVFWQGNDFTIRMPAASATLWRHATANVRRPCFMQTEVVSLHRGLFNPVNRKQHARISFGDDAIRILNEPNAGGTSENSEAMSMEVLRRAFGAKLRHTEMSLQYWPTGSKKTDYSVTLIDEQAMAVSVTRAADYRGPGTFTDESAQYLLQKKLQGVIESNKNVIKSMRWKKQILHIWVSSARIVKTLRRAYRRLSSQIKANTIVITTLVPDAEYFVFRQIPRIVAYDLTPEERAGLPGYL